MHAVPVEKVRECQDTFLEKMRSNHQDVLDLLGSGQLTDEATATIERVMEDIAGSYKG